MKPALRAALVAIPVYLAACAVSDGGLFRAARFRDVHVYQGYAEKLLDGSLPYRDVFVEYPPGAFAVFLPPTAFGADHYNAAFKTLMALCGAATIVLVALVLAELGASQRRIWIGVGLLALSPIGFGHTMPIESPNQMARRINTCQRSLNVAITDFGYAASNQFINDPIDRI